MVVLPQKTLGKDKWNEWRGKSLHWIRPVVRPGKDYAPPETDSGLNAAEQALGSRLPASCRAFARRFGLSGRLHTLPELFRLMPFPGKRNLHWCESVVDATQFWKSPAVNGVGHVLPADFLQQAIVFGCDEGELTFLFHTGEVTEPGTLEYRVYQIPRHEGPEPICESFVDWLRWVHKGYESMDDIETDRQLSPAAMPCARYPI